MTTTKTETPSSPIVANPPVAPVESTLNKAKAIVGRIPRLPDHEEKRRLSSKGERVTAFSAFDWASVPAKHLASSRAAVAVVMAHEAAARAALAIAKSEAALADSL